MFALSPGLAYNHDMTVMNDDVFALTAYAQDGKSVNVCNCLT